MPKILIITAQASSDTEMKQIISRMAAYGVVIISAEFDGVKKTVDTSKRPVEIKDAE